MAITTWPFSCDPALNGRRLYCAPGTPDGAYVEPLLDGMRWVGTARYDHPGGVLGSVGVEISPSPTPLTGIPMTGGVSTPVVIPVQCRPYQLIVGWDVQGVLDVDAQLERVGVWLWPKIDGVPLLSDTPLYVTTLTSIVGGPAITLRITTPVVVSANPDNIGTYPGTSPVTVECALGAYFATGAAGPVSALTDAVAAMRTYIQYV